MSPRIKSLTAGALLTLAGALPAAAQINPFSDTNLNLTPADLAMIRDAAATLYEGGTAGVGDEARWENPESGNAGSVALTRIFQHEGMTCRQLQHRIVVPKVAEPHRFVSNRCEVSPGVWKAL